MTCRTLASYLDDYLQRVMRLCLCGENCPEWVATFWGCVLLGAVVVPLDKDNTEEFVFAVQQQTDAMLIVADSESRCSRSFEELERRLEAM